MIEYCILYAKYYEKIALSTKKECNSLLLIILKRYMIHAKQDIIEEFISA